VSSCWCWRRRERCRSCSRGCWRCSCSSGSRCCSRWGWRWAGWWEIDIALPAGSRATHTVAEVLCKECIVSLHASCGTGVTISQCAVDHIEATLPLVQPQLEVGTAAPREILRPPLNVEDAVGSTAAYRCEDPKPTIDQIPVVPVRVDRVVVSGPWQALVGEGRVRGCELRIAVGRQIDAREGLVVQGVRERQRDGGDRIIPVIADVRRARHDTAPYLADHVLTHAGRRRWRRRLCWSRCRRCSRCRRRRCSWRRCRRRAGCRRGSWRAATHWRLDRNGHRRTCLEVADHCKGVLRRLIGVKPEIIKRAPPNRICVLILRKCFTVPSYGIGRLSHSPGSTAVTLIVKRAVICPAGLLRRRVKADIANVHSRSQRHTERLNPPIQILVI
jgi:hypothetical protein